MKKYDTIEYLEDLEIFEDPNVYIKGFIRVKGVCNNIWYGIDNILEDDIISIECLREDINNACAMLKRDY